MSAFPVRRYDPHAVGKQRKQLRPKGPDLRLAKEFDPWGPRARRLGAGERHLSAAAHVVLLSAVDATPLNGVQLAKEYTWVTGERRHPHGVQVALISLRARGLVEDVPVADGGEFIRGIWMRGNSKPVRLTPKGKAALALYRKLTNLTELHR